MEHLAGLTLIKKNQEEVSADEVLSDKEFVAFYFIYGIQKGSEFQEFDQLLANCYEQIKEEEISLEIIFVPGNDNEKEFLEDWDACIGDWLTVPYGSPAIKELDKKFDVGCIPHIAVVNRDNTVVSTGGCCCIKEKGYFTLQEWCYQGDGSFWKSNSDPPLDPGPDQVKRPPSNLKMEHLAALTLLKKNQEEVSADEILNDKEFIGFYFSDERSEKCRDLTSLLVECYVKANEDEKMSLEMICVPCDDTEEEMIKYMNDFHEDWLAVPIGSSVIEQIKDIFRVEYVPHIIVVKKDGTIMSSGSGCCVQARGFKAFEDWCK